MTADNWVSLFPILPTKAKEKTMAMLVSDKPLYSDLVKNFEEFHKVNSPEDLLKLQGKWGDDSNYSNDRTIEDLLENLTEDDLYKTHTVTVDIKDIFSSEKSLGGCDRPLWTITNQSAIKKQLESLNRHKKYCSPAAQTLSAMLRPHPTKEGLWQVVKFIGSNRLAMKLFANGGLSTRVLMLVSFHEPGQPQKDYIKREAELHATDAGDRSGQNEEQKFSSGFRAQRPNEVYAYELLRKHEFNYKGIMQQEGVEGCENWISILSLQGIKDGQGNGIFKKYGEEYVDRAFETTKRIALEITKEEVVGASPIESFTLMNNIFTQYGKTQSSIKPLFTPQELEDFLIKFFEEGNRDSVFGKKVLMINDLSKTGSVKDIAYICGHTFWPEIVKYWMSINGKQIGFSTDCYAIQKFLDFCSDKHLKKELRSIVA